MESKCNSPCGLWRAVTETVPKGSINRQSEQWVKWPKINYLLNTTNHSYQSYIHYCLERLGHGHTLDVVCFDKRPDTKPWPKFNACTGRQSDSDIYSSRLCYCRSFATYPFAKSSSIIFFTAASMLNSQKSRSRMFLNKRLPSAAPSRLSCYWVYKQLYTPAASPGLMLAAEYYIIIV